MPVSQITDHHHEAAQLLADGELTNSAIAEKLGVTCQTLWNWKQREDFVAPIEENPGRGPPGLAVVPVAPAV